MAAYDALVVGANGGAATAAKTMDGCPDDALLHDSCWQLLGVLNLAGQADGGGWRLSCA